MKKLITSGLGVITIVILCLLTPIIVTYGMYGETRNGHIVMRYPHCTEVSITTESGRAATLIGRNDCTPEYKLISIPGPKIVTACISKLTEHDLKEWNAVMQ